MKHLRETNVLHDPQPLDAQRRYSREGNVVPVFMQTRVRVLDLDEKYNRPTGLPSRNVLLPKSPIAGTSADSAPDLQTRDVDKKQVSAEETPSECLSKAMADLAGGTLAILDPRWSVGKKEW